MSRSSLIIVLGMGAGLLIGVLLAAALLIGRTVLGDSSSDNPVITPISLVTQTPVADVQVTTTATMTATAVSDNTSTATPTSTSAPATISVLETQVQYVQAQTDLNVRSGPGTGYEVIGWLADGQTAKVTGVSSDFGWWRIVCADDSVGNCWVSAHTNYTQTTSAPVTNPPCVDAATFVADVTMPDGTSIMPETPFDKIWRIKNSGTCTWTTDYKLVHVGGYLFGASTVSFNIQHGVAPGESIDLLVHMLSPKPTGSYQSDWKLQNAKGHNFGIGKNRNTPFWVKIVVTNPIEHTSSIDGFAWQDRDRDNILDTDEFLAHVTITLATGHSCEIALSSAHTDGYGRFAFTNLAAGNYCLLGKEGEVTMTHLEFSLQANQHLSNMQVTWPPPWAQLTTIAGGVYQDVNQNGRFDGGEPLVANQEVNIFPGPSCHVAQDLQGITFTDANGRYALAGEFDGIYCVGLRGKNGLEDVVGISVSAGETINNINLKLPIQNGTISGWVWHDYCLTDEAGNILAGDCVSDGTGAYHADGFVQPTETFIPGVTMQLQLGSCIQDNPKITAVTDNNGRYIFNHLQPGTYCVSINPSQDGNAAILLPGDWTFPDRGVRYHEVVVHAGQHVTPIDFGWDYEEQ